DVAVGSAALLGQISDEETGPLEWDPPAAVPDQVSVIIADVQGVAVLDQPDPRPGFGPEHEQAVFRALGLILGFLRDRPLDLRQVGGGRMNAGDRLDEQRQPEPAFLHGFALLGTSRFATRQREIGHFATFVTGTSTVTGVTLPSFHPGHDSVTRAIPTPA